MVSEHAAGRPVGRVAVDIGTQSGVLSDAVRFCFDVVAAGTCVAGAVLEIREIEARGRCRQCRVEFAMPNLFTQCACGSRDVELVSG
ncbi:hydrogenase maturation nickel metallochaperone HypA, partial [Acinetobacter baumannii]